MGLGEDNVGGGTALTPEGLAFDDAWTVYRDRKAATELLVAAYMQVPATQALMQGLHGRAAVPVEGAQHLLVRHGFGGAGDSREFRRFLQVLNDLGIIAYSKKHQSVRVVAPMPSRESPEGARPKIRVVEKDRPFSNIRHFREVLRECREHIWWVDPNFERRGLELLVDEADAHKIKEIKILSGGRPDRRDVEAFKLFKIEMANLGITAEWRMVDKPDVEWHDRYVITKGKAWNVTPISALFTGKHSQITESEPPPFDDWWEKAKPVEEL